tara:strand:- start:7098 stop:8657 length:1560 start_codon:yes stop_codon:yes gene_type:complete
VVDSHAVVERVLLPVGFVRARYWGEICGANNLTFRALAGRECIVFIHQLVRSYSFSSELKKETVFFEQQVSNNTYLYQHSEQQLVHVFARTSVSARMIISIAPAAVSSWCRSNSRRRSRASRLLCSSSFTPNGDGDDDDDNGGKDNDVVKGLSAIKRTNTNVDEDAILSNIADSASQKRKADEFAQMLNAAKKYSESKKMGVETPSVQGGGDSKKLTAEERIAQARGYATKKKEEMSSSKNKDASEEEEKPSSSRPQKSVNVQIISKDTSYNPFDEDESVVGMDDIETGVNYKPKVSTWGVFPRPKDISKEYGGGRTLKKDEKGQNIIESKEETEARKIRVAKKLEKYRTTNALNMTKEEEEKVREALAEANEFLRVGSVTKGIAVLEPFEKDINARSELGGQVIFCYAMCLDNAQRRDEALKQYKRVLGNQYGLVSKQAERMLWGMTTASKKMKADLFDYESDRRKFTEDALEKWVNPKWRSREEDDEEAKKLNEQAIMFVFGLVGLPLISFIAYLNI